MRYDKHPYPSFTCGYTPTGQSISNPKRESVLTVLVCWVVFCLLIAKVVCLVA